MSISSALKSLCPTAQWSMVNDDYSTIVWHVEPDVIPTQAQVDAAAVIVAKEQAIEQVRRKRAAAYAAESDPLFFKAQRGEATMDDWRTAVASIQLSIPYPDEEVTQ